MSDNRNKIRKVAFGGIITAVSVVFLFISSFLGIATYAAPALAGLLMVPLMYEAGRGTSFTAYAAVSAISLFFIPEKELAFMYVSFFGYYALIKDLLEKIRPKFLSVLAKFAVFNVAIILAYVVLLNVIAPPELVKEFSESGIRYELALLAVGNLLFAVYDFLLKMLSFVYIKKIRPKLGLK